MLLKRWLAAHFFYGWVVVAAACLLSTSIHSVVFAFGAYFEPLSQAFGATRGAVSLVFSITFLLALGLGGFTGPLADRLGARRLVTVAALTVGVGLILASRATELWQVYLTYSVAAGIGFALTTVPVLATVQRWFVRRRGMATGLAVTGNGIGTFLGPTIAGILVGVADWRTAYLVTGIVAALLMLIGAWLLVVSPAEFGLGPDGAAIASPAAVGHRPILDVRIIEVVRSSEFGWLYLAFLLVSGPMFLVFAHIVPAAQDQGLDRATASLAIGALGVGGAIGRLILGPFADRLGRRGAYALSIGLCAGLLLIWPVLPFSQAWVLLAYGFIFGIPIGGFSALGPALMADYFGAARAGSTIGIGYTGFALGALTGPWLAGILYDATRSYLPAVFAGVILFLLASAAILRLPNPAVRAAQPVPEAVQPRPA